MNENDNQGRGDRQQLPDGSGIVIAIIGGLALWCALFNVYAVVKGWL